MYNKKKATDKPVGKSSGLNHSSSGKASEKHNFPKQNDSKRHLMSVLSTKSAAAASTRAWLTKNSYL